MNNNVKVLNIKKTGKQLFLIISCIILNANCDIDAGLLIESARLVLINAELCLVSAISHKDNADFIVAQNAYHICF